MKTVFKFVILISINLSIISCGSDDFKQRSELGDLRVLALIADTPEVNSATTVSITPVLSYVDGGGATLNYSWEACPDPGIDFGAEINCDTTLANLKQSDTGTIDTSTLAGSSYTGATTALSLSISADVITYLNLLSSEIQFNGVDYLFIITITDPTTNFSRKSFKKIKISNKANGELNTNPTMGNILFNESALTAFPSSKGDLTVDNLSSPQNYELETNVGTKSFDEDAYVSWYITDGEVEFNRTDVSETNQFNPKDKTSGSIVAVYRDGRGGVAFSIESF